MLDHLFMWKFCSMYRTVYETMKQTIQRQNDFTTWSHDNMLDQKYLFQRNNFSIIMHNYNLEIILKLEILKQNVHDFFFSRDPNHFRNFCIVISKIDFKNENDVCLLNDYGLGEGDSKEICWNLFPILCQFDLTQLFMKWSHLRTF